MEENDRKCPKCGHQLAEDDRFCLDCGQRVQGASLIDRIPQYFYLNLSPRRRFYRSLVFLPLTLVGWFINLFGLPGAFWFSVLLTAALAETIYNYVKWKRSEST